MTANRVHWVMIDDDATDVKLFELAAQMGGLSMDFESHATVERGIHEIRKHITPGQPIRVVLLLDLHLPGTNGLEALQALRGDPHTRSLPIVMLTSSNDESDIRQSYALGANAYVTKPFGLDASMETVRTLHHFWEEVAALPQA